MTTSLYTTLATRWPDLLLGIAQTLNAHRGDDHVEDVREAILDRQAKNPDGLAVCIAGIVAICGLYRGASTPGAAALRATVDGVLGVGAVTKLRSGLCDAVESRMARAVDDDLPVFESGGLVALAETDSAIRAFAKLVGAAT